MPVATTGKPARKHDLKGADKKEAFHRDAESRIESFAFGTPADANNDRLNYYLAGSDILKGAVQVIGKGDGDLDLHYHPGGDGFWMVLQGKVRFYGPDGVIGEYGPLEGLLMPRNARYWFEAIDPHQDLHLLHITGKIQTKVGKSRLNVDKNKSDYARSVRIGYPEEAKSGD